MKEAMDLGRKGGILKQFGEGGFRMTYMQDSCITLTNWMNENKKLTKDSKIPLSIISILEQNVYEISQHISEKNKGITNNLHNK